MPKLMLAVLLLTLANTFADTLLAKAQISRAEDHFNTDLNAATAALKLDNSSARFFTLRRCCDVMLAALLAGALAAAAWTFVTDNAAMLMKTSDRVLASTRSAAAHFLVYVLSGPRGGSALELKTIKTMKTKAPLRKTFSLDLSLEPIHLTDGLTRRCYSASLDNTLMAATLEQPMCDMYALSPSLGCSSRSSCRRSSTSRRRTMSNNAMETTTPAGFPIMRRNEFKLETKESEQVSPDTSKTRHPGRKPDIKRLRNHDVAGTSGTISKMEPFVIPEPQVHCKDEDDWEDDDWECDSRAEIPETGVEMDGFDVGCLPHRTLVLPKAATHYVRPGVYGRSIFTSEIFKIPRASDASKQA